MSARQRAIADMYAAGFDVICPEHVDGISYSRGGFCIACGATDHEPVTR